MKALLVAFMAATKSCAFHLSAPPSCNTNGLLFDPSPEKVDDERRRNMLRSVSTSFLGGLGILASPQNSAGATAKKDSMSPSKQTPIPRKLGGLASKIRNIGGVMVGFKSNEK